MFHEWSPRASVCDPRAGVSAASTPGLALSLTQRGIFSGTLKENGRAGVVLVYEQPDWGVSGRRLGY